MAEEFVRTAAGELFTLLVHPTLAAADLDDVARAMGKITKAYSR